MDRNPMKIGTATAVKAPASIAGYGRMLYSARQTVSIPIRSKMTATLNDADMAVK